MKTKENMKGLLTAFAASIMVGALGSAAMAQNSPVANFNYGYLNGHPEIAQQLAGNPALVDNSQFMGNHPGLREYFATHPEVRSEIRHHPYRFMSAEDRVNNWQGRYWPSNWTGNYHPYPTGGWNSFNNASWRFDHGYLSQHPEVAQQLSENPALIDNPNFRANHPGLDEYLENHPQVRTDLRQHPYMFMGREDQQNRWHEPYAPVVPHPVANTDRYLDQHPEVAQQLNGNPRLIDNSHYVDNHPGLHEFLNNHPDARTQWQSHPYQYQNRENHYDKTH
jgi:hypothetical protein